MTFALKRLTIFDHCVCCKHTLLGKTKMRQSLAKLCSVRQLAQIDEFSEENKGKAITLYNCILATDRTI